MGLIVVMDGREIDTREVVYRCLCCNEWVGYEGEGSAYERHVVLCAKRHEVPMRERSLRVKAPGIFDPEQSGDVELGKWIRKHRAVLLEGRKKL